MKITKQRLSYLLLNALEMLDEMGADVSDIKLGIGITDSEMLAVVKGNVEDWLTQEERYKIFLEVSAENKLQDIETRVRELSEGESPYLCGLTEDEVIGNEELMNEILRRYERAEGWVDNSDYWYLVDDCIRDVLEHRTQIV